MGLTATPLDTLGFAFLGNMIQGQAPPTISWDNNYFHKVSQPCMPSIAAISWLLVFGGVIKFLLASGQ
jgi:hypothetical protein